VSERIVAGKSLLLQPKLTGLPVFGGEDSETGWVIPVRAFQTGFSRERCLDAWAKIGAATSTGKITRACLMDKQVMQGMGDANADDDEDCLFAGRCKQQTLLLLMHSSVVWCTPMGKTK
jgi:hypothetical protein